MNDRFEYSFGINGVLDGRLNYGVITKVVIDPARTPFFSLALDTGLSLLEVAEFLNCFKVPFPRDSVVHSITGKKAVKKLSDSRLVDVAEDMYEHRPTKASTFGDLVDLIETQVGVPNSQYTMMVGAKGSEWENAAFVYGSKSVGSGATSRRVRQIEYQDKRIVGPRFRTILNMSPLLSQFLHGYEGRRASIERMVRETLRIR